MVRRYLVKILLPIILLTICIYAFSTTLPKVMEDTTNTWLYKMIFLTSFIVGFATIIHLFCMMFKIKIPATSKLAI